MPQAPLSDVELLARLVAFDTTSHNSNLEMAGFVADYLDRPGVRVVEHRAPEGDKANLLVWVGPEAGAGADRAPGLTLSGHMDVVPAGEPGWTSDPFTLTERGARLVARGSAAMKGVVALAANLAREADPAALRAPLALALTYDEEVGTLGARHLAESWRGGWAERAGVPPLPAATIIGEPTALAVVGLHKGHLKARVTLHGRSAHSGYPHLGVNAVEAAGRVIEALAALRAEFETERPPGSERFAEVPFVPLNVGTVAGGSAINVVPERAVVEVGLRLLPGMESAPLVERLRLAVAGAAGVPFDFEVLSDSPPMRLAPEAPVARALCAIAGEELVGAAPCALQAVHYATDAGWLQRLGLDCAIFGPGSIEVAHRPDEYLPRAELAAARRVVGRMIERFCGGPGEPT
jgi:acetylornithine deacetylase